MNKKVFVYSAKGGMRLYYTTAAEAERIVERVGTDDVIVFTSLATNETIRIDFAKVDHVVVADSAY